MSDRDITQLVGWDPETTMVTRHLGRDPTGAADRLRIRKDQAKAKARTFHGTCAAPGAGEK